MHRNARIALIIGGIILAVLIIVPTALGFVYNGRGTYGGWGMMGTGMMGFGGGWFMPLGMIFFWGLVIWGIIALIRNTGRGGASSQPDEKESAMDILKKRYARGEICKDEFETARKALA